MSHLSVDEKIQLLKNLLEDPDDWISWTILQLDSESEENPPAASQVSSSNQ